MTPEEPSGKNPGEEDAPQDELKSPRSDETADLGGAGGPEEANDDEQLALEREYERQALAYLLAKKLTADKKFRKEFSRKYNAKITDDGFLLARGGEITDIKPSSFLGVEDEAEVVENTDQALARRKNRVEEAETPASPEPESSGEHTEPMSAETPEPPRGERVEPPANLPVLEEGAEIIADAKEPGDPERKEATPEKESEPYRDTEKERRQLFKDLDALIDAAYSRNKEAFLKLHPGGPDELKKKVQGGTYRGKWPDIFRKINRALKHDAAEETGPGIEELRDELKRIRGIIDPKKERKPAKKPEAAAPAAEPAPEPEPETQPVALEAPDEEGWREVGKDEILPPGMEIRMNLSTGKNEARPLEDPAEASAAPAAAEAEAQPEAEKQPEAPQEKILAEQAAEIAKGIDLTKIKTLDELKDAILDQGGIEEIGEGKQTFYPSHEINLRIFTATNTKNFDMIPEVGGLRDKVRELAGERGGESREKKEERGEKKAEPPEKEEVAGSGEKPPKKEDFKELRKTYGEVIGLRQRVRALELYIGGQGDQVPAGFRKEFAGKDKKEIANLYKEKYEEFKVKRAEYVGEQFSNEANRMRKTAEHDVRALAEGSKLVKAERAFEFVGKFYSWLSNINIGKLGFGRKAEMRFSAAKQTRDAFAEKKDQKPDEREKIDKEYKNARNQYWIRKVLGGSLSMRQGVYYGVTVGLGAISAGVGWAVGRGFLGAGAATSMFYGMRSRKLKQMMAVDHKELPKMNAAQVEEKMREVMTAYGIMGKRPTMLDEQYAALIHRQRELQDKTAKKIETAQRLLESDKMIRESAGKYKKNAILRSVESLGLGAIVASGALGKLFKWAIASGHEETAREASQVLADSMKAHGLAPADATDTVVIRQLQDTIHAAGDTSSLTAEQVALMKADSLKTAAEVLGSVDSDHIETIKPGDSVWEALQNMKAKGVITDEQMQEALNDPASVAARNAHLVHANDQVIFHPAEGGRGSWVEVKDFAGDELRMGGAKELAERYLELGKDIPDWLEQELKNAGVEVNWFEHFVPPKVNIDLPPELMVQHSVDEFRQAAEAGTLVPPAESAAQAVMEAASRTPERYRDVFEFFRKGFDYELLGNRVYYNSIKTLKLGEFLKTFSEERFAAGKPFPDFGWRLGEGAARSMHERFVDMAGELKQFNPSRDQMAWTVERFIKKNVVVSSYGA